MYSIAPNLKIEALRDNEKSIRKKHFVEEMTNELHGSSLKQKLLSPLSFASIKWETGSSKRSAAFTELQETIIVGQEVASEAMPFG